MGGKKPLRRPLWPPTRATASNYYPLGLDGAGGAAKPLLRAPKKPAPLHGRLPAFSGAVDAFERARKCFLEWRYFFSIILSEFLKNRVALQLYFKNDSGNLIALTSAVRELKVAEEPEIARTEDGQWEVTGGKIVAVLANGLERDITALVEYRDDGSGGVEAVYTYGTSVQPYTKSVRTVSLNGASAAQPGIGNGAEEGVTENGVTSFKAGTSAGAPEIRVTAPANGWAAGENIFTVASDGDAACTVMVKKADGTLVRLTASTADGTHSFTAVLAEGDSLVVGLKGDVNGDGEITSRDIVQAQAGFLGKLTLQDHRQLCGAVSGGDAIGSRDIVQIRAAFLGKLTLKW